MTAAPVIWSIMQWQADTFAGQTQAANLAHLDLEVAELRLNPDNLEEAIDVIFLALQVAGTAGHTSDDVVLALWRKLRRNRTRTWVYTGDPNIPVEHDRGGA